MDARPFRDPALERLVDRLVAAYAPEAIYLFGSRALGTHRDDSDYDLLVVVPDDAPEPAMSRYSMEKTATGDGAVHVHAFPVPRAYFEDQRRRVGTITFEATHRGRLVFGEPAVPREDILIGESARMWVRKVDTDLNAVENCLYGPKPDTEAAAYHCQQAAEKLVKTALVLAAVQPPKTHLIDELLALLPPGHPRRDALGRLRALNEYSWAFRYPHDKPMPPTPAVADMAAWLAALTALRGELAAEADAAAAREAGD